MDEYIHVNLKTSRLHLCKTRVLEYSKFEKLLSVHSLSSTLQPPLTYNVDEYLRPISQYLYNYVCVQESYLICFSKYP